MSTVVGDHPGRVRLEVTDTSGHDQLGLLWGVRSRYYSSASTAALKYAAQSLTPLDTAANSTVASTACVRHLNLSTGWTPVLGTNLTAGTFLTHAGSYRVWARVYTTSVTPTTIPPKLRLVYDVGDLTLPAENKAVAIPGPGNFYLVDLGEIRLDPVSAGDHRWQGVLQAKGAVGGENVSVAEVLFVPLDESTARASASPASSMGPQGFTARDGFKQSAGNLAGKTAEQGGVWTGAGDSDDFTVNATDDVAERSAISDTTNTGRFERLGTGSLGDVVVSAEVYVPGLTTVGLKRYGVFARYVDINNWVAAVFSPSVTGTDGTVFLVKRLAGVIDLTSAYLPSVNTWWPIKLSVIAGIATLTVDGLTEISESYDPDLGVGGALESGGYGLWDEHSTTAPVTRRYRHFGVYGPTGDAVVFGDRQAELATNGMCREDATGTAYGPVSHVTGDLPRIPPSGAEGRPVELFLRGSRGDLEQLPDRALDGLSVTPHIRPSWLLVPGT